MVILFAAGNCGIYGSNTVLAPGTAKNSITVGSSENDRPDKGNNTDNINDIAFFSSRGFTDDNRIKPDVVAPGTYIISTRSSKASRTMGLGNYDANTHYTYGGGTSMSTPIVAGMVALIRQYYLQNENITPTAALIKATLINGAVNLSHPLNNQGW
jgi:subtilisin family serine protease